MRPRSGQDENKEDRSMSTSTTERPHVTATTPEWRRIGHWYSGDSPVSVCGTAQRKSGEDHFEPECNERGHTICVVCAAMLELEPQAA
jgi:hypothetical protein